MSTNLPILNVSQNISEQLKLRTQNLNNEIFDPIRKKWIKLTPEEWVRQNVIQYIAQIIEIPTTVIGNEITIKYNNLTKRCDSIIYTPHGEPLIIVEYKRTTVKISQSTFDQIAIYNMQLNVPFLILSNGLEHFFCMIDKKNNKYIFCQNNNWPKYKDLISLNNK